jgi:hypothetical protein
MEAPNYPSVPKILQRGQGREVRYFLSWLGAAVSLPSRDALSLISEK